MSYSSGNIIPTVDNFKLLSIDDLKSWPIEDIQRYSTVVGTVVLNQMSTITVNSKEVSEYETRISEKESIIESIDKDILQNYNSIISYNVRSVNVTKFNNEIDSTVQNYLDMKKDIDNEINVYYDLIKEIDKSKLDLQEKGDTSFELAARHYSTLYVEYLVLDNLYKNYEHSTTILSSMYEKSKIDEQKSLSYMQLCADNVLSTTVKLNKIYDDGESIQSRLTQYKIDEIKYTYAYSSTTAGLIQLSTLYDTAILFDTYNNLVSTNTSVSSNYINALNNYNATLRYNTRISGTTADGWFLLASTLADKNVKLENQISLTSNAINTQIPISQTRWIQASDAAVDIGSKSISSLRDYLSTSDANLTYYSSMYSDGSSTMRKSAVNYTLYNTFYVSTVAGSNDTMNKIQNTINTYGNDQTGIDETTARIEVLREEYTALTSSVVGNITYSTAMGREYVNATEEFIKYSTLYYSTANQRIELNSSLIQNESSIYGTISVMNTESTIVDMENIKLRIYDTEMATHLLIGDVQSFKQRELYVVSKQVNAQTYYDMCVLENVKNNKSSETNVNMNTSTINLAYKNLTVIQEFLDTFDSVYKTYDNHMVNLLNLSTSINQEKNAYSDYSSNKDLVNLYPNDSNMFRSLENSSNTYIKAKLDSAQTKKNLIPTKNAIYVIRNDFIDRYMKTFPLDEISQTESTITSKWNEGVRMFNEGTSTTTLNTYESFIDTNRIITTVYSISSI